MSSWHLKLFTLQLLLHHGSLIFLSNLLICVFDFLTNESQCLHCSTPDTESNITVLCMSSWGHPSPCSFLSTQNSEWSSQNTKLAAISPSFVQKYIVYLSEYTMMVPKSTYINIHLMSSFSIRICLMRAIQCLWCSPVYFQYLTWLLKYDAQYIFYVNQRIELGSNWHDIYREVE